MRETVRFADAVRAAAADIYLEIGPDGSLTALGLGGFVPALRKDQPETDALLDAIGRLHVRGVRVDWPAVFTGWAASRVTLPTYPFARVRHWIGESTAAPAPAAAEQPALLRRWEGTDEPGRRRIALDLVRTSVAQVAGHAAAGDVAADATFHDLGLSSLAGVDLLDRVNRLTGLALPPADLFDHPTPERLAAHVLAALEGTTAGPAAGDPVERDADDPIAIVAMSCRLPGGVATPDELWRLLADGADAIGPFPADRGWDLDGLYHPDPDHEGTSYVRSGGFLDEPGAFDVDFFGISPREALGMDPQQRLLLTLSWEAFESAGIDVTACRGDAVGVFVGATATDYGPRLHEAPDGLAGRVLTGTTSSVASGRIAYTFGFHGPALTVDTACSSSLVALHLAAQSLERGECTLALAGAATVLATPGMFVEFSRQRGLAPDGRCKPFAAAADGTGWSEGGVMLLLERLSDARRHGHPVLATIRGSAVNSDGASNGLTAPSGAAQQRVIRSALAAAGLRPSDVDAVEAHGTGTALGDPIEAQALLAAYGRDRTRPLLLGSVKSNIGHTQAAAGAAGLLKMVLAMRYGRVPATLHVDAPTPKVDWPAGVIELATAATDWPATGRPRRAGISSFGISGTNAHVIIEEAEPPARRTVRDERIAPWVLSARTPDALRAYADRLAAVDADVTDAAFTLATGRPRFAHRMVAVGADLGELRDQLTGDAVTGRPAGDPRAVFVFPGQGAQWAGMAAELLRHSEVFAAAMAECASALRPFADWSLLDVLGDAEMLERVDVVQPALWAVMVSLAELWRSYGIEPAGVVGHSQGEIAAACVAGVLSLADGARVVALRSRALSALAGAGGMVSVPRPPEEIDLGGLSVAAINGPRSTVVSGPPEALAALLAREDRARRVPVDYASHSPQVERLREQLLADLAPVTPQPAVVPFHSTVTGEPAGTTALDAGYWYRNLRESVRFRSVVGELLDAGATCFIEVSPHPVVSMGVAETVDEHGADAVTVETLRRGDGGMRRMLTALGEAFVHGLPVRWERFFDGLGARRIGLPGHPLRSDRYWLSPARSGTGGRSAVGHPLLDTAVDLADGGALFTARLSVSLHPWLDEHRVGDVPVLPGAAYADLALWTGARAGFPRVGELTIERPLRLPAGRTLSVQIAVGAPDGDHRSWTLSARDGDQPWIRYATGTLRPAGSGRDGVPAWPTAPAEIDLAGGYQRLADAGFGYGPSFRGLRRLAGLGDELFAEVAVPAVDGFAIAPALLDSALHALELRSLAAGGPGLLPFSFGDVELHRTGATELRVRLTPAGPDTVTLTATDPAGALVLTAGALVMRPLSAAGQALHRIRWAPLPAVAGNADPDATATLVACGTVHEALKLVRDRLADDDPGRPPLAVVTTGAVAAAPGDEVPGLASAPVWGLLRSAQSEHPGRFVLVDTDTPELPVAALAAVLEAGEDQVAVRDGVVLVPRLVRATPPAPAESPIPAGSTVLITGAPGALGSAVARHLVTRHGVRDLLLASRRGPAAPGAETLVVELEALGARVTLAACDVADRTALATLLATVPDDRPLKAVVHAAGVLDDGVLTALTPERLDAVLRPKAEAAWHLHELTHDLAAFVLFSSAMGVLGNAGQGNYAAANAYLDALAAHRRARRLPAVSLAWGLWETGGGLTGHLDRDRISAAGVLPLATTAALELLDAGLNATEPVLVPARIDVAALRAGPVPPILRELVPRPLRERAAGAPPVAAESTAELVGRHVAAVAGLAAADVDPTRTFREFGFDSLASVGLRNRLAAATGLRLPVSLVFDHPTPAAVAAYLRTRLSGDAAATAAATGRQARPDDDLVAIVGMACRFPGGAASPEQLWDLLADGRDAITGLPTGRGWPVDLYDPDPDRAGHSYAQAGGFLHDAADFDAEFFGISPREALSIDPQQRILLETSWEAIERAGIDPHSLRDSRTGVFAGIMYNDYATRFGRDGGDYEAYLGNGSAASVASGRVAYQLGLHGPAVSVDTACSSSLVAVHLAAQALRHGECSLALAGGVTVMATPKLFLEFSRQRGLSRDGRSKAFGAGADGMGAAEGAGMLLLERLSDARRHGHPVLAVIRGSAVNSDGASNGLTAPNGPAQQRVIADALAAAGLRPSDVDAVEAHGTGTALGDPIEAEALIGAYGTGRDRPLWLGSVKSNIGHTQAAAGVAGIIKMVLALGAGELPRTLHADEPTPHVDWSAGTLRLLRQPVPWPAGDRPRRAAVSSFGISGTNAHLVLEEAPVPAADAGPVPDTAPAPVPWLLSGRVEAALRAQAARLRPAAGSPAAGVGIALATQRSRFEHRAVVVASTPAERDRALAALAAGDVAAGLVRGVAAEVRELVFVFPGQGAQWPGMGAALLDASAEFRAEIEACEAALAPYVDWSLTAVLRGLPGGPPDRVDVVQPALFAMMAGLARVWQAHGVRPTAVVGHSQGEIAAAYVAGALSLPDAARVVALRSQAIAALAGSGGMASIALPVEEVRRRAGDRVGIAAVNGPRAVVVSGDAAAVQTLVEECTAEGIRARLVPVDYASHSPQVDAIRDELLSALAPITPRTARIPFHSTVEGRAIDTTGLGADYWFRNLRRTVQLAGTVAGLPAAAFIEVSPHPVLTAPIQETVGAEAVVLGSLRRGDGTPARMLTSLAEAYVRGVAVDWSAAIPPATPVPLPTYPFQRSRYWLDAPDAGDRRWAGLEGADDLAALLPGHDPAELRAAASVLSALRERRAVGDPIDDWRYRVEWRHHTTPAAAITGRWAVLAHSGRSEAGDVLAALRRAGAQPDLIEVGPGAGRRTLATGLAGCDGVLSLLGLDDRPHPECPSVPVGFAQTVALVQALGDAGVRAPLWCVTRRAVGTAPDEPVDPNQALLWGLGRVVGLEHPDRWGGLVDLDGPAGRLAEVLGGEEDQVAIRKRGVLARRLTRQRPRGAPAADWTTGGTALVTGGTGALGAHVARWLAGRGAQHLLLVSRRGPDSPGAADLADSLRGLGAEVTVAACDVADREALAALVGAIPADRPLRTVVHTAAALDDGTVDTLTPAQLERALRVKASGARNLHELTRHMELDAFVLYSSLGGTVGLPGQGNYAPANAYLDALAEQRRAQGLVATSVVWGAWAGGGLAAGTVADVLRRHGLPEMDPALALEALGRALSGGEPVAILAAVDWSRFWTAFTALRPSPMLTEIPDVARFRTGGGPEPAVRLATATEQALTDLVCAHVAAVLGHDGATSVRPDRAFRLIGFDSVTGVELRNRIAAATGLSLPTSTVFDFPTPAALAGYLRERLAPAEPGASVVPEPSDVDPLTATDDELFELIDRDLGVS
ncbi:type I polyketide synthase [Micromonospora halophytica]|uniref:type I polyketide synthase n=1 Tax=Micromonospora halophytica TaxID=47864 RepID=UPI001FDF48F4|nr:type I polyketide synthase [Micromonospora halophytica]